MNIGLVGKMEQRKNSLVLLNELNKVFSVNSCGRPKWYWLKIRKWNLIGINNMTNDSSDTVMT